MSRALCVCVVLLMLVVVGVESGGGRWEFLQASVGISAMHMQLLHNDKVIMFDRTDFGRSNISLPHGYCRHDPRDTALKVDCTAHSIEYDSLHNTLRPLTVQTDVWCSSGAAMQDGTLLQTGGFNDGERRVRIFKPCHANTTSCDWHEVNNGLVARRWYATNHILPDGRRQIIIGGRRQFNYEFYPKSNAEAARTYSLPFLVQTNDRGVENNLYPFVHLAPDGSLFIFANNRAILFDYSKNAILKTFPTIPGGDPRNYPSTGSSVLLPLRNNNTAAEVLICGGAPKGSFLQAMNGNFVGALNTCARIKITDPDPQWAVETMPFNRVMGDMTLLPNGDVLIINGAGSGTAGWEYGRDPVLSPLIYRPDNDLATRFEVQNPTTIPRMYHSTAVLLRDGSVLVGGSNPHVKYQFTGVMFPTELSLERFSPSYMDDPSLRPKIVFPQTQTKLGYSQKLTVRWTVGGQFDQTAVAVTIVAPSFTTHSFSMNQRAVVLEVANVVSLGNWTYQVEVTTPSTSYLAPSGYYLLFAVHKGIPGRGIWVHLQ